MIISRTPFRISFVGGGTDIRKYYKRETGAVLSTTIDKYIYVAVKQQFSIVDHKFRINWNKTEHKDNIDEIEHPIVREGFKQATVQFEALEILEKRQEVKELAKENIRKNFPEEYFEIQVHLVPSAAKVRELSVVHSDFPIR